MAGDAVADRFRIAARCRGNDHGAEQHRLDQGAPERLVHRGHQEDVAGGHPRFRRMTKAHEAHAVGDASGSRALPDRRGQLLPVLPEDRCGQRQVRARARISAIASTNIRGRLRATRLPKKPTTRASGAHRSSRISALRARARSTGAASVSNRLCTTVHLCAGEQAGPRCREPRHRDHAIGGPGAT